MDCTTQRSWQTYQKYYYLYYWYLFLSRTYQEQFFYLCRIVMGDQVLGSMCYSLFRLTCPKNPQTDKAPFDLKKVNWCIIIACTHENWRYCGYQEIRGIKSLRYTLFLYKFFLIEAKICIFLNKLYLSINPMLRI